MPQCANGQPGPTVASLAGGGRRPPGRGPPAGGGAGWLAFKPASMPPGTSRSAHAAKGRGRPCGAWGGGGGCQVALGPGASPLCAWNPQGHRGTSMQPAGRRRRAKQGPCASNNEEPPRAARPARVKTARYPQPRRIPTGSRVATHKNLNFHLTGKYTKYHGPNRSANRTYLMQWQYSDRMVGSGASDFQVPLKIRNCSVRFLGWPRNPIDQSTTPKIRVSQFYSSTFVHSDHSDHRQAVH